ncbi:hypothetical protein [Candidatus Entotheonella palauensis]|uniref:hypothetical protein n=1 Tax=Candidatus Entotheonella palauensis TaxID=93172 RepID=UPI000B7D9FF2|nr:hypothetical protein [Candidatus Entotheonella palauensis]
METVTLYRAVSEEELQQLLSTGKFDIAPNALEGKFFAEHPEHAIAWGEALEGAGQYRVMEVDLSARVADELMRWARLDGIGPARYATLSQLESATIRLYEP